MLGLGGLWLRAYVGKRRGVARGAQALDLEFGQLSQRLSAQILQFRSPALVATVKARQFSSLRKIRKLIKSEIYILALIFSPFLRILYKFLCILTFYLVFLSFLAFKRKILLNFVYFA